MLGGEDADHTGAIPASRAPDEELPVIERAPHPWALAITAPLVDLPGWMPRIRRHHPARPPRVLFARGTPGAEGLPALGFRRSS